LFDGIRAYAKQANIEIDGMPKDPKVDVPPEEVMTVLRKLLCELLPNAGSGDDELKISRSAPITQRRPERTLPLNA